MHQQLKMNAVGVGERMVSRLIRRFVTAEEDVSGGTVLCIDPAPNWLDQMNKRNSKQRLCPPVLFSCSITVHQISILRNTGSTG
jgi:hypothetical protein